jgi:hypothetical protein
MELPKTQAMFLWVVIHARRESDYAERRQLHICTMALLFLPHGLLYYYSLCVLPVAG